MGAWRRLMGSSSRCLVGRWICEMLYLWAPHKLPSSPSRSSQSRNEALQSAQQRARKRDCSIYLLTIYVLYQCINIVRMFDDHHVHGNKNRNSEFSSIDTFK